MLLAGDCGCLKTQEDSIDLYNKCRGRQPLKKWMRTILSQTQRAILREEDNLIKKWLKAIRTILSQAQRAILREEDNLIKNG